MDSPVETLTLSGPVGCGKTYTAAVAAHRLLGAGEMVTWESVPGLMAKLRASISTGEDVVQAMISAQALVLDDLGAERQTEYALDCVFTIVGARYDWLKRTIITTNLTIEEMGEHHDRLASRLTEGLVLRMTGADRRLNRG
jgi:DNA replication protein DnaC